MTKLCTRWLVLVLGLAGLSALAHAQPPRPAPARPEAARPDPARPAGAGDPARPRAEQPVRPWAKGVTKENQEKALALFRQGNTYFGQDKYSEAMTRYREAIRSWDHPAIRYNMVVCLIHLNKPLLAYASVKRALRYGKEPLGNRLYREALTNQKLLKGRLAWIKVVCAIPGVQVSFQGKAMFVGPGEETRILVPDRPVFVVARKAKYITQTRKVTPVPGRVTVVKMNPLPVGEAVKMKRRWPTWMPWTVLGAGFLVAAAGIPLILVARNDYQDFDDAFKAIEDCQKGCYWDQVPKSVQDIKNRANAEKAAGYVFFSVGGAAMATAVVLIILNRLRPVPVTPKADSVSVLPLFTPGGGGLTASFRF